MTAYSFIVKAQAQGLRLFFFGGSYTLSPQRKIQIQNHRIYNKAIKGSKPKEKET